MILLYQPGDQKLHAEAGKKLAALKTYKHGYIVEVKRNCPIRSNEHNRYYRAVLKIIATHTGQDADFLHDLYKAQFNYEERAMPETGEMVRIPRSTSKLDTEQFSAYVTKIKQHAREDLGCDIPEREMFDLRSEMEIREQYDRVFNQY